MADRPQDITSPITDHIQPLKTSADDARRAGRVPYAKPTADNAIVLFIDRQIGLMAGVRDVSSLAEYMSNVVGLARTAKARKMPGGKWRHAAGDQGALVLWRTTSLRSYR